MKTASLTIISFLALVAFIGCGGAADTDAAADAEEADSENTEVADPMASESESTEDSLPSIPLCPGEDEPGPDDCQRLVYGQRGYCNRWLPCESL